MGVVYDTGKENENAHRGAAKEEVEEDTSQRHRQNARLEEKTQKPHRESINGFRRYFYY